MPLSAANYYALGPVKSVDQKQFYDLLTGTMTDQPVTFRNTLSLGGNQNVATVPLKLYGAIGQTTNLIDLYTDRTAAQPGFGFSAVGNMAWGPGGAAALDTFLSRIALQNGHGSDTAGVLITPRLEVLGDLVANSLSVSGGGLGTISATRIDFGASGAFIQAYGADASFIQLPKLTVTPGTTSLAGLTVNGASTLNGALTVNGNSQLNGTLVVSGGASMAAISAASLATSGAITATGHIYANSNHVFFSGGGAWFRYGGVAGKFDTSHPVQFPDIYTPGPLRADGVVNAYGGTINFEASNAVKIQWRSDLGALYAPYGNGLYLHELTVTSSVQGGKPAYVMGQSSGGRCYWWPASAIGPPALRSYAFTMTIPIHNGSFQGCSIAGAGAAGILVNNGSSLTAVQAGYYAIMAVSGGYNNVGVKVFTEGVERMARGTGSPNAPDYLDGIGYGVVQFINAGGLITFQGRSQQAAWGGNAIVTFVPTTDYIG